MIRFTLYSAKWIWSMSTKILETFLYCRSPIQFIGRKTIYVRVYVLVCYAYTKCIALRLELVKNLRPSATDKNKKKLFSYLIVRFFFWFCYRNSFKTLAELRPNSSVFLIGPRNIHYMSCTISSPCFSVCSGLQASACRTFHWFSFSFFIIGKQRKIMFA